MHGRRRGAAVGFLAAGAFATTVTAQVPEPPPSQPAAATQLSPRLEPGVPRGTAQRAFFFEPTLAVEETLTSNANFDRGSSERRADFVTMIAPGFRVDVNGAHTSLAGAVTVPIYLYARTGEDNNRAVPDVRLAGTAEALDRHLFLDAGIDVHREFASPLGARPSAASVNTDNEILQTTYRLAPALRGEFPGGVTYEVIDHNIWTRAASAPAAIQNTYTNELIATLASEPRPLGWMLEYDRSGVDYESGTNATVATSRLRLLYDPDPQVRLSATVGYENDNFGATRFNDTIYGVGVQWRPSGRTALDASWEHRFFGSAYRVAFDHRTPRTVWNAHFSRDLSTSADQLASLGTTTRLSPLFDALLTSRYPDPAQRQQAVDQLTRNYALPSSVDGPVNLYAQQFTIVTDARLSAGILGARNSIYFTAYRQRDEVVIAALAELPFPYNVVTQTGGSVVWSSRLQPLLTLTSLLSHSKAVAVPLTSGREQHTDTSIASFTLSTPISPLTEVHAGVRYQVERSNIAIDREEAAVFVGILHRFH